MRPQHTAQKRLGFVTAEIMADAIAQNGVDFGFDPAGGLVCLAGFVFDERHRQQQAPRELCQLGAHLPCRDREIDEPRGNRVVRHFRMAGAETVGGLRQGEAAMLLDSPHAQRAVAVAAGKHHAGCKLALVGGKSGEEHIDGFTFPPPGLEPAQLQPAVADADHRIGGHDMHGVRQEFSAVLCHTQLQARVAADDPGQLAFPRGAEMGHHHQGNAGVGRQAAEKPFQRLDTASRRADADDREFWAHCVSVATADAARG